MKISLIILVLVFLSAIFIIGCTQKDSVGDASRVLTRTSNATRTNTSASPIGQPIPLNMTLNCSDTDGGNVPSIRGTVRAGRATYIDYCHPTRSMYELFCGKRIVNGTVGYRVMRQDYYCPTACGGTPYCY